MALSKMEIPNGESKQAVVKSFADKCLKDAEAAGFIRKPTNEELNSTEQENIDDN